MTVLYQNQCYSEGSYNEVDLYSVINNFQNLSKDGSSKKRHNKYLMVGSTNQRQSTTNLFKAGVIKMTSIQQTFNCTICTLMETNQKVQRRWWWWWWC